MGLHDPAATLDYARATYELYLSRKAAKGKGPSVRDLEDCLCDLRYRKEEPGRRRKINDDIIPLSNPDTPDLTGQRLATVVELKLLPMLMDRVDKDHFKIDISPGGQPKNPARLARRLNDLGSSGRRFRLARGKFLGRKLVWFTTEAEADRLTGSCTDATEMATHFCSGLGLGHHLPGTWLALLRIPGSAIQRAGHYRPVFCDAGVHRWFMARSSVPNGINGPWGQTAALKSLADGTTPYDGCPERVSREMTRSHLRNATIGFDLLGRVELNSGSNSASTRLCEDVWTRRR